MVSRASSSSAQISSASISPLDCNMLAEISRMACKVSAALRLGFGFSSCFSVSFACRSCWTRAGRSSGGALAMATTAFSVGLMLPERISCLMPGATFSAGVYTFGKLPCAADRSFSCVIFTSDSFSRPLSFLALDILELLTKYTKAISYGIIEKSTKGWPECNSKSTW